MPTSGNNRVRQVWFTGGFVYLGNEGLWAPWLARHHTPYAGYHCGCLRGLRARRQDDVGQLQSCSTYV